MDRSVLFKRMFRFYLVSAIVVALSMGYQLFFQGDIAVVTKIFGYQLPTGISRWWDVVFGPVWVSLIVLALSQMQVKEGRKITERYAILVFSVTSSFFISFLYGLTYGFMLGLVVGLVVFAACLVFGFIVVFAIKYISILWDWLIVKESINLNPEGDEESG